MPDRKTLLLVIALALPPVGVGAAQAQVVVEHLTIVSGPIQFSSCGGYGFDGHCCGSFGGFISMSPPVIYGPLPPPSWPVAPLPNVGVPAPVWQGPVLGPQSVNVTPGISQPLPTPSTTTSKLQSLRLQAKGDHWFRKQEYSTAYVRYRDAVREAPDRGAAHLRLALALTAIGQYERAARQIQTGLRNDPQLLESAASLDDVFGEDNLIAKKSTLIGVTDWVKEEVSDPNRLFLIGTLLALDAQTDKATELLEAGRQLAVEEEYFQAMLDFLQDQTPEDLAPPAVAPQGNDQPIEIGPALPPLPSLLEPLRSS